MPDQDKIVMLYLNEGMTTHYQFIVCNTEIAENVVAVVSGVYDATIREPVPIGVDSDLLYRLSGKVLRSPETISREVESIGDLCVIGLSNKDFKPNQMIEHLPNLDYQATYEQSELVFE